MPRGIYLGIWVPHDLQCKKVTGFATIYNSLISYCLSWELLGEHYLVFNFTSFTISTLTFWSPLFGSCCKLFSAIELSSFFVSDQGWSLGQENHWCHSTPPNSTLNYNEVYDPHIHVFHICKIIIIKPQQCCFYFL